MSIAGGLHKAVELARACGCDCLQLFTKNNNQWRARALTYDDVRKFRTALAQLSISHPIAHDSYLINLATPDKALWKKSIDAFVIELLRAEQLGIPYVVMHPGAYTTGSEQAGLRAVVRALDEVHRQVRGASVRTLVETTAGQGSSLGWRFEQLATILDGVRDPERLGVCFDTCHVFAAGYPLSAKKDYLATMTLLDQTVGLGRIKGFHLNDSKKPLGSRVDRHEHIGRGMLGLEAFGNLLSDRRFRNVPMYLETPKEKQGGVEMDVVNLQTLRSLVKSRAASSPVRPARSRP